MTPEWSRLLEEAGEQLLAVFAAGTVVVCLLAALTLLWERVTRPAPPGGAYYVGRHDAIYFVAYSHLDRLDTEPAWSADAEPLADAILRHCTGRRPRDREVRALATWLEVQPQDGFVLETAELAHIVGAPLAGRPRVRASDDVLRAG
jgi:hypothetical protein